VTADPLVLIAEVDRATSRLVETFRTLDGNGLAAPSLCDGWTRGHVLSHLSRNADAYLNLLDWARTGVETPMYVSPEARDADIDAGANRPLDVQLSDLTGSAAALLAAADRLPASAWTVQVRFASGLVAPAARVVWSRLCEVELHHVDLAAGYGPADWPEAFSRRLLRETLATSALAELVSGSAPRVTGPEHILVAWLTGRSDGAGLTVSPPGALPPVPKWK
jgi:maleylpyruvate isomerase